MMEMVDKYLFSNLAVPEMINFKEKSNILKNMNNGKKKEPLVVVLL